MTGPLTAGMIHEAEAHCPLTLDSSKRWAWLAERLNDALAHPDAVCTCCGVNNLGEDCSDLRPVVKEQRS